MLYKGEGERGREGETEGEREREIERERERERERKEISSRYTIHIAIHKCNVPETLSEDRESESRIIIIDAADCSISSFHCRERD